MTFSFSECGNYHSLKWYRDTTRVFVYSPIAGFKNAEDILMDRSGFKYMLDLLLGRMLDFDLDF